MNSEMPCRFSGRTSVPRATTANAPTISASAGRMDIKSLTVTVTGHPIRFQVLDDAVYRALGLREHEVRQDAEHDDQPDNRQQVPEVGLLHVSDRLPLRPGDGAEEDVAIELEHVHR